MDGPGKYDDECLELLVKLMAKGVLLVVIDGDRGHGVSVKVVGNSRSDAGTTAAMHVEHMARTCRMVAKHLEADADRIRGGAVRAQTPQEAVVEYMARQRVKEQQSGKRDPSDN
jgi:hypothetical protein